MEDYKKIAIELGQTLISKAPETREDVERMLPELKESEDERIVKELLTFFRESIHGGHILTNKEYDSWIAWIEKQGEHKKFRDSIQVGDKVTRNEDGMLVNLSQLSRVAKKDEKQGEQKSAWSEEDNIILSRIIADYERSNEEWFNAQKSLPHGKKIIWLKSLKERVQPKQEWSEEDKRKINDVIVALSEYANGNIPNIIPSILLERVDFLKSLRPPYYCDNCKLKKSIQGWKPSDEQIHWLK